MSPLDPFDLIPPKLIDILRDKSVDLIADLAENLLGDKAAKNIRKLRSDGDLRQQFTVAIERGLRRFRIEFTVQDPELVETILRTPDLFKDKKFLEALITVMERPGSFQPEDLELVMLIFVRYLPGDISSERVERALQHLLKCLADEIWRLPQFLPIYQYQLNRMIVEVASRQTAIQAEQLAVLKRIETRFELSSGEEPVRLELPGHMDTEQTDVDIWNNLPQRNYVQFIGRTSELDEIIRRLKPYPQSQYSVVTISGVGGIGKSTLALETAFYYFDNRENLPQKERFQAIVWVSGKRSFLTADGIKLRKPEFKNLEDVFTAIAVTLELEHILKAPFSKQEALVRRALKRQRTLLILDNLETVDDQHVQSFVYELPAPTKAVITTRHSFDSPRPIHLTGMSPEEARILITLECFQRGVQIKKEDAQRLFDRTGGLPLAMVWSIAQIGIGNSVVSTLRRLGSPTEDVAKYCFEGSIKLIKNQPAYHLLLALTLFTPDASREALGNTTDLGELDRDDGLAELERLSLVHHKGDRFSLMPLTMEYAKAEMNQHSEFQEKFARRRVNYLISLCQGVEGDYYWRYFDYRFHGECENILAALDWLFEKGPAEDVFTLCYAAFDLLDQRGRWKEYMTFSDRALSLAEATGNLTAIGRLCLIQGWIYLQRGEYALALQKCEKGLKNYQATNSIGGQSIAYQHISSAYRKQNEFGKAEYFNNEAMKLATQLGDGDLIALINVNHGKLARDKCEWQKAWDYFESVKDWFENRIEQSPRDENLARSIWSHLGTVAYFMGKHLVAKDLLQKSLDVSENYGTLSGAATTTFRLALTEEALGEPEKAMTHVTQAMEVFQRLEMKPDYLIAKKLHERLRSKEGK